MQKLFCPECFKTISFFRFLISPTPDKIVCPSCSTRLKVGKHVKFAVLVSFMLGLMIGAFIMLSGLKVYYSAPASFFIILGGEYLYFLLIRKGGFGLVRHTRQSFIRNDIKALVFIIFFLAVFFFITYIFIYKRQF